MHTSVMTLMDDAERRYALRHTVCAEATLRDGGLAPVDAKLYDLSTTGFLVKLDTSLPVGSRVRLGVAGEILGWADVVRHVGALHGCRFGQPITANTIQTLRHADHNVAQMLEYFPEEIVDDDRFPVGIRMVIIFGGSALLWTAIGGMTRLAGLW